MIGTEYLMDAKIQTTFIYITVSRCFKGIKKTNTIAKLLSSFTILKSYFIRVFRIYYPDNDFFSVMTFDPKTDMIYVVRY